MKSAKKDDIHLMTPRADLDTEVTFKDRVENAVLYDNIVDQNRKPFWSSVQPQICGIKFCPTSSDVSTGELVSNFSLSLSKNLNVVHHPDLTAV